jgi:hypothetical protein
LQCFSLGRAAVDISERLIVGVADHIAARLQDRACDRRNGAIARAGE